MTRFNSWISLSFRTSDHEVMGWAAQDTKSCSPTFMTLVDATTILSRPSPDRSSTRFRIARWTGDAGGMPRAGGMRSARLSNEGRALHGAGGSRTRVRE